MTGWIKLHRKLLDHKLWCARRRFSMAEAWIDLLLRAAHADQVVVRDYGNMRVMRGQLLTSQLALAKRWRWHRESVSKFLRLLNADSATSTQTSNQTSTGYTLITILNYDKYQGSDADGTDSQTDTHTSTRTSTRAAVARQSRGTYKKEKKEKKYSSANGLPAGFTAWWTEYPKKVGKIQTVKAWEALNPDEGLQTVMLDALRQQKRTVKAMLENDRQHILDPERWLRYRRWEDEVPPASPSGVQYPRL
jgi:hypothetical protein